MRLTYTDDSLVGLRFGKLVVEEIVSKHGWKRKALCKCDCGSSCIRFVNALMSNTKRGATPDCGCFRKTMKPTIRHGQYKTKEYCTWIHIKQRCYNKKNKKFPDYGGRGIKVCERWLGSFESFFKDMGLAPSMSHSINRIDNDGDYTPENCEWATPAQQSNNKRNLVILTIDGKTITLADAAKKYGINERCLRKRIRCGWDHARAVTEPSGTYHGIHS